MQYALLIYGRPQAPAEAIPEVIAAALREPFVTGWVRLHADGTAATLQGSGDDMLFTDGPFVESKEYLAGIITIEAGGRDEALAVARRFHEARGGGGAIEVRPIVGSSFRDR